MTTVRRSTPKAPAARAKAAAPFERPTEALPLRDAASRGVRLRAGDSFTVALPPGKWSTFASSADLKAVKYDRGGDFHEKSTWVRVGEDLKGKQWLEFHKPGDAKSKPVRIPIDVQANRSVAPRPGGWGAGESRRRDVGGDGSGGGRRVGGSGSGGGSRGVGGGGS